MTPNIMNPEELPGAFLFFTFKLKEGRSFACVAYDSTIKQGQDLKALVKTYLEGGGSHLPYMEVFAELTGDLNAQNVWKGDDHVSCGGVFGGVNSPNRHSLSDPWPFITATANGQTIDHPIKNGIYLSYWNLTNGATGIHTSSTTIHFHREARVPYMNLWAGPGGSKRNLIGPDTNKIVKALVTELYLDWYATFDGDSFWKNVSLN